MAIHLIGIHSYHQNIKLVIIKSMFDVNILPYLSYFLVIVTFIFLAIPESATLTTPWSAKSTLRMAKLPCNTCEWSGKIVLNYCVWQETASFTFLLAKNSIPRTICNDQENMSLILLFDWQLRRNLLRFYWHVLIWACFQCNFLTIQLFKRLKPCEYDTDVKWISA
jgi:hypothetical protein